MDMYIYDYLFMKILIKGIWFIIVKIKVDLIVFKFLLLLLRIMLNVLFLIIVVILVGFFYIVFFLLFMIFCKVDYLVKFKSVWGNMFYFLFGE